MVVKEPLFNLGNAAKTNDFDEESLNNSVSTVPSFKKSVPLELSSGKALRLEYTGGTLCDVGNNQHRATDVYLICDSK